MITICAFDNDVIQKAIQWHNDKDFIEKVECGYTPQTAQQIISSFSAMISNPSMRLFGIKKDDVPIGYAKIKSIDLINRCAEVHSVLVEEHGKGYGIKAMEEVFRYAFYTLNLNRLYTSVFADDEAMVKFMDKTCLTREGELRNAVFKKGRYINIILYGILRKEFTSYLKSKEKK